MKSSVLISGVLVCLGLSFVAINQKGEASEEAGLLARITALEERLAKVELNLANRTERRAHSSGLIVLEPIVTNLKSEDLTRYVRVGVALETRDGEKQEVLEAIEGVRPKVNSWLLGYLADKTVADVRGLSSHDELRQGIKDGLNSVLNSEGATELITGVYFDDISVQ